MTSYQLEELRNKNKSLKQEKKDKEEINKLKKENFEMEHPFKAKMRNKLLEKFK